MARSKKKAGKKPSKKTAKKTPKTRSVSQKGPSAKTISKKRDGAQLVGYEAVLDDVVFLLGEARRTAARSVNAVMTATYWLVGKRIVECEQQGKARARYGKALIERLSADLSTRLGRGFSTSNLEQMRRFYVGWPIPQTVSGESQPARPNQIPQTPSGKSVLETNVQTASAQSPSDLVTIAAHFPLPWSHYVRLLTVEDPATRRFYEEQALRGGWSVRQLGRQISSQFYERTLLSKNKAAMLRRGAKPKSGDLVTPEEELKDPYVLEFLELKDEYSESDLEAALITKLESFLLELGGDFAFIGRQRVVPHRPALFPPALEVSGRDRPQAWEVLPRGRGADAPLPQLRA